MPFFVSSMKSKTPFELIHRDVWGPFSTASSSGAYYFLTIVDDYTRCTWLYLMKTKTKMDLCPFHDLVKNQFNFDIKMVRCNNGTEFLVKDLQQFFQINILFIKEFVQEHHNKIESQNVSIAISLKLHKVYVFKPICPSNSRVNVSLQQ